MHVILTGTDPDSARGGIGVVMAGYLAALEAVGIPYDVIPTYEPGSFSGKWRPWAGAFPALTRAVRRASAGGEPVVVYSHAGSGASLARESAVLAAARAAGARTVIQLHAPEIDRYMDRSHTRWLLRSALLPAQRICLLTPWWQERIARLGIERRTRVIPNPLTPELYATAQTAPTGRAADDAATVTLLTMARLVRGKGVDLAIHAMKSLPANVRLLIAGDGNHRPELERLTRNLGLADRVSFVGWVSGEEKRALLESADIFCLPTTHDAFPMTLVEAMAHGIPVVATRWGGIPDMVAHGRAGVLCPRAEAGSVAAAVELLLPAEARQRIASSAKEWVLEISSPNAVGRLLRDLFAEL